jgi:hypothetical protein
MQLSMCRAVRSSFKGRGLILERRKEAVSPVSSHERFSRRQWGEKGTSSGGLRDRRERARSPHLAGWV